MHINGHRDYAADEDHVISARVARVFLTLQHCVDPCEARNTVDAHLTRDIRPLILGAAGKAARQFRLVRCKYVYDKPRTRLKRRNDSAIAP